MKGWTILFSLILIFPLGTIHAETYDIEFPRFYKLGPFYLFISYEAKIPEDSQIVWVLYDKDGEKLQNHLVDGDDKNALNDTVQTRVYGWTEDKNGIGHVEIYLKKDFEQILDPDKAILIKKVPIYTYFPQKDTQIIKIDNGKFEYLTMTINFYDSIYFEVDCDDCYHLEWKKNPVMNYYGKNLPLLKTEMVALGEYVIGDKFGNTNEITLHVVFPDLTGQTTITQNQTPQPESTSEFAESELDESVQRIPDWVRNIFKWYGDGQIGEKDLINAIQFLIKEGIIKI